MSKFSQKGISLYLSIMIMVILLSIVLGMSGILLGQLKMMKGIENSVIAFYAADTGIEKVLEELYSDGTCTDHYDDFLDLDDSGGGGVTDCPIDLLKYNDACYKVLCRANGELFPDESVCGADNYCIRSLGVFREIRRSIEVEL